MAYKAMQERMLSVWELPERNKGNCEKMKHCHEQKIKKETCYVRFGKGVYESSASTLVTVRNEDIIFDFDKKGRVIGFELLGSEKKCQK